MTLTLARRPAHLRFQRVQQYVLSALLGTGFTAALFLAIAHFERLRPEAPAFDYDELRAITIPLEPPPPPRVIPSEPIAPITPIGIENAPSDSPVKIAVSPPDLDALLPPPPVAPPASIQVGQLYADLKPKVSLDAGDLRIYQANEVDQIPQVLYRVNPQIPREVRGDAASLRIVLLIVIDTEGVIKNVQVASPSGNPAFDAIITENIRQWTFSPAIKKGKKVKCLLDQKVIVRWAGGSPFQT